MSQEVQRFRANENKMVFLRRRKHIMMRDVITFLFLNSACLCGAFFSPEDALRTSSFIFYNFFSYLSSSPKTSSPERYTASGSAVRSGAFPRGGLKNNILASSSSPSSPLRQQDLKSPVFLCSLCLLFLSFLLFPGGNLDV